MLPEHGRAATLANEVVVELFVRGNIQKAADASNVYFATFAASELEYLAGERGKSIARLGGSPDSVLLVSHEDNARVGTIYFYYVAVRSGVSVTYMIQVTQERRGLNVRSVLVGERIPPPNDTSDIPIESLSELIQD